jgi:hypothetical protein
MSGCSSKTFSTSNALILYPALMGRVGGVYMWSCGRVGGEGGERHGGGNCSEVSLVCH